MGVWQGVVTIEDFTENVRSDLFKDRAVKLFKNLLKVK